jgi:hypothetical protein
MLLSVCPSFKVFTATVVPVIPVLMMLETSARKT